MRLICLPYAGGSAMIYARWRRQLPSSIDVVPLELPGRGVRMDEPLHTDPAALADQLAVELAREPLAMPYVLFGHSLGGLIAYEVAQRLCALGAPRPKMLLVSGTEAPAMRDGSRWLDPLSDDALRDELLRLKGTPPQALENAEIMRGALPVLRADFLMCGNYVYRTRPPLRCPIHVFGGDQDETRLEALDAWRAETSLAFGLDMLPGDHFFIHTRQAELLRRIAALLAPVTRSQVAAVGAEL
ncbi:thioesterase [Bradyrhizobium sp. SSBR45G]|uniref:thioesterase II family protein n=1 Tax=unclassified Bradyrhizobium TaxID=2631580 RepID=UPI002342A0D1|nr:MULTISPECIES: alpha/beta fold hydrolase [unclassified Bradyrhizobium]GLH79075.1 thioesterase [Bradyrhizobium sp. SSBR45G]GLH86602.1 thioesterase [Bradyrhizobium sp. SSBR45R]